MTYEEFKNEVLGKGFDVDGYFGEQCPMKGTLIEKANGIWVEVENLVKDDRLKGGNIVLSNNRKKSEIIHIETALGHLYVSPEHRFILADGSECLARNLTIGQIIQSDLIEEVTDPEYDLTDDELRFLGLWFADGTKKYRWETSQSPECFVTVGADQKVKYIEGLNLSLNKKFHSNGKALIYVLCNKKHPSLVRAIDETKNKEMTRRFTKDQFALIIEGYIVGDGSPKHNSSATTSVDKKLLLSVQYGCSINGWRAKLSKPRIRTEVQVNGYCKSPKPLYHLTVNKNKKPVAKVLKIEKYDKEDIYVLNVDGNHTYYAENHLHHNCWDLFGYYCQRLGYPVIHTDKTGYAQDLWESRATNGILNSFDEVTMMEPGDVAIFKRTAYTPLSHVAIFDHDIDGVNGAFLGQNQGGQVVSPNGGSASNIISLPYSATYDTAFRPKCFAKRASSPSNSSFPLEGADISQHNDANDWSGFDFLIPRCSYGEHEDRLFSSYVNSYKDKIKGIYVFSYALDSQQARQEAEYAVNLAKKYGLTNPIIFYDYEYDSIRWAKQNGRNPSAADVQAMTTAFALVVQSAGYQAGTYLNLDYWNTYYKGYSFKDQKIWFACYNPTLSISPEFVDIWQYSSARYDHNRAKADVFHSVKKESIKQEPDGSVYRLYNPNTGDHLFTANFAEAQNVANAGWTYEGVGWQSPAEGEEVYRLYQGNVHDYVFKKDVSKLESEGWTCECVAFKSGGTRPIYRMFNQNDRSCILTSSLEEHNELSKNGWFCQGQEIKY